MAVSSELGFFDGRSFSLFDYRHGHAQVVVRGFPPFGDAVVESGEGVVLDLCFLGVQRISCWKDIGPVHLRVADTAERATLESRIGPVRRREVFLLEPGSIESYVIAGRVVWAEFLIPSPFTLPSPLDSQNREEAATYRPVGGFKHSTRA
ncbi:hypothetical protein [Streptomyces liangshanensis]|uniref:Uncharacterized protein n=1 Tax=Streptomyces liangshanensis TaxID=2717324 RepID=A0A6G9H481_9ACTN|nr:hypothetical protein [Streptomyces liangshanensis]QIQ05041.1 hypothetical protein HA039_24660 [Streptomyces liangshanensis]